MQKRTKREIFTDLRKVIEELSLESQRQEEFLDLIDRQIHDLDKRKESELYRAKKSRDEKSHKADVYDDMILANISDERFMTIDEIIRNIDNPDLTKGRIIKSLNNLVRMGVLEKRIKRIKGKKKTVFKALEYVDELQFEEEFFVEEKDPVYSQDALYLEDFEEAWWEE